MISIFGFIIALVFIFIIIALSITGYKAKGPLFSSKLSKWLIVVYSAVLVISGIILYVLPYKSTAIQLENKTGFSIYADEIANGFANIIKSGKLESYKGIYKNQSYKFNYNGNEIGFSVLGEKGGHYDLWIERKNTDDGVIEADSYVTKVGIYNEDITKKLQPPTIKLTGNTLSIFPGETYKTNYIGFNDDFTSAQFSHGAVDRFGSLAIFTREIIHLRIPGNVSVNEKYMGALNVNYIN